MISARTQERARAAIVNSYAHQQNPFPVHVQEELAKALEMTIRQSCTSEATYVETIKGECLRICPTSTIDPPVSDTIQLVIKKLQILKALDFTETNKSLEEEFVRLVFTRTNLLRLDVGPKDQVLTKEWKEIEVAVNNILARVDSKLNRLTERLNIGTYEQLRDANTEPLGLLLLYVKEKGGGDFLPLAKEVSALIGGREQFNRVKRARVLAE